MGAVSPGLDFFRIRQSEGIREPEMRPTERIEFASDVQPRLLASLGAMTHFNGQAQVGSVKSIGRSSRQLK